VEEIERAMPYVRFAEGLAIGGFLVVALNNELAEMACTP